MPFENQLPSSWKRVRVDDIKLSKKGALVSGPFGSNIGKRFFVNQGVPVIRGNNLTLGNEKFIDNGFVFISEEKANELRNCKAIAGDIVFTAAGTLGQVGLIPNDTNFTYYIISNKQLRLRCDTDIVDPTYAYYWFSSLEMRAYIKNQNTGASIPLITLGTLRNLPINLPPLPVQKKISYILTAYDDLIENNTRRIRILEEMAQAIYREWFVNYRFPGHEGVRMVESALGLIPEGWETGYFTDYIAVLSGGTPKTTNPEYWGTEIPWFTPQDLTGNYFIIDTTRKITNLGLSKCNSKLYPRNTVFITARGTVGKCVLASIPMAMSQTSYALVGKNGFPQYFIFLLTKNKVDYLKQQATGAVFDTIIVDTFRKLQVIIPKTSILDRFHDYISPIFLLIENLQRHNLNLHKQRDLLLPRLVSGDLDISNPGLCINR